MPLLQPRYQLFSLLEALVERAVLRPLDYSFSQWLAQKLTNSTDQQLLLASLVSQQLGEGHVCVALNRLADLIDLWPVVLAKPVKELLYQASLDDQTLCDGLIIGDGSTLTPLVLDRGRLYLHRYWQYECAVANRLLKAAQGLPTALNDDWLKTRLDHYFPPSDEIDWQRVAAAVSVKHKLSVISGGPGTGKTTTVTKLLAIYIESQLQAGRRPQIQLAAPTGKAAARLSESIAQAKTQLTLDEEVLALIPEQGKTLHRLLGSRRNSRRFIHHADNPLPLDLLVVDEASMIDLPMMASIIEALSDQTRLILIGDRDQLASVEAGSVLGDICAAPEFGCYSKEQSEQLVASCHFENQDYSHQPFADNLAFLRKSYRFSSDSGIGALAGACNIGSAEAVEQVMGAGYSDLHPIPLQGKEQLYREIALGYQEYFALLMQDTASPSVLLDTFARFQILCALRVGRFGAKQINLDIEQYLAERGVIEKDVRWYVGRPIMITRNDSQMNLYNGDIGVTARDTLTGQLKVWFEQSGELRAVLPSRLPQHESVFAMTVHKSQGSEFEHVLLLLGDDNKVVNRELVYTAVTRAKNHFSYIGAIEQLAHSVTRTTQRVSGLSDKIWQV